MRIDTPGGELDVIGVHIPNGSGNGWKKIDSFHVLARALRRMRPRPLILAGDFNEPRAVRPNGQIITFGQLDRKNGGVHSDGNKKDCHGEVRPRVEWDVGVRSVLAGETSHGLRHAYLTKHGSAEVPVTHRTRANPRFFDHVFVSEHIVVRDAGYHHPWRENGWSDHSAAWVELEVVR